jgi:hypothetical protein
MFGDLDAAILASRVSPAMRRWDHQATQGCIEAARDMATTSGLLWDLAWEEDATPMYAKSWRELVKLETAESSATTEGEE